MAEIEFEIELSGWKAYLVAALLLAAAVVAVFYSKDLTGDEALVRELRQEISFEVLNLMVNRPGLSAAARKASISHPPEINFSSILKRGGVIRVVLDGVRAEGIELQQVRYYYAASGALGGFQLRPCSTPWKYYLSFF